MILYYSSQVRIFNGSGFTQEKILLFKFLNNYSIKQLIEIVKILELNLNIHLNFNLKKSFIKVLENLNSEIFTLVNKGDLSKELNIFLMKKYLILYFIEWYKNVFLKYRLDIFQIKPLFLTFKKNDFLYKKGSIKKNVFLSTVLKRKYKIFLRKNKIFLKNKFDYLRLDSYYSDLNNNIYLNARAFDFYKGSITPFNNSKFSWFASTGLKSDVECNDLEVFKKTAVKLERCTFYKQTLKDIIFKVRSFNKLVTKQVIKKVRHLLFYNSNKYLGSQRFISESKTSFNFKQNNFKIFSESFFLLKNDSENILNFFFTKTFSFKKFNNYLTQKIFFYNNLFYKKQIYFSEIFRIFKINYFYTYNHQKMKIFYFLFKFSKQLVNYYYFLKNKINFIRNGYKVIYKSLISFAKIQKIYSKILTKNLNKFFFNFSKKFYIKKKVISSNFYSENTLNFLLHIFIINKKFCKLLLSYILKSSFFYLFFNLFVFKKNIERLEDLFDATAEKDLLTELSVKKSKKLYWFSTYKSIFYYIFFCIDWKLNFDLLVLPKQELNLSYLTFSKYTILPFERLLARWGVQRFVSLQSLYLFFFSFLEKVVIDLQKIFYSKVFCNKFICLEHKFNLINFYLYFYKLQKRDLKKPYLLKFINLSGIFLGQWFYYRHVNKMLDNKIDYFYSDFLRDNSRQFTFEESILYKLNFISEFNSKFNFKLDYYLRENLNFNVQKFSRYNESFFTTTFRTKKKIKKLFHNLRVKKYILKKKLNKKKFIVKGKYRKFLTTIFVKSLKERFLSIRKDLWMKNLGESFSTTLDSSVSIHLRNLRLFKFKGRKNRTKNIVSEGLLVPRRSNFILLQMLKNIFSRKVKEKERVFFINTFLLLSHNKSKTFIKGKSYYYFWFNK